MAIQPRLFYQVFGLYVSSSPSTGYFFNTGFNNVYTGSNSGNNLITNLERVQSVNDSWNQPRLNVLQFGQIAPVDRIIVEPPTVPLEFSYLVDSLANERRLGFDVSGVNGCIGNILNLTQTDKTYFIAIAPPGVDVVGYTGQMQTKYVTNGYLGSWSTEAAVGGLPTTTVGAQGFNWATATGSFNQPLQAVDYINNVLTTGNLFTLPVATSGIINTVAAIRPSEITCSISNPVIGLNMQALNIQRYNFSFNLNLQKLTRLGNFFPYALVISFPVDVTASITAYYSDLTADTLSRLQCNDATYTLTANLLQPYCLGAPSGLVAAQYKLIGAKLDSQSFPESVSDIAAPVTLNFTSTLGSATDQVHNFFMSGINGTN